MKTANTDNSKQLITQPVLPQGWAVTLSECGFDFRLHEQGREFDQWRVLAYLKRLVPAVWPCAEVVGGWVWVQRPHAPADPVCSHLYELGFHWNQRRQVWQHPCGQLARRSVRGVGSAQPREPLRYFPAQVEAAA